jgi:predicted transcriptional regulator of viral defense system
LVDWIVLFVRALHRPQEVLKRKIEQEWLLEPLAPLAAELLAIADAHGRVTVRDAVALTGSNRNTIKDHLGKLVAAGRLKRLGRGRGTWHQRA